MGKEDKKTRRREYTTNVLQQMGTQAKKLTSCILVFLSSCLPKYSSSRLLVFSFSCLLVFLSSCTSHKPLAKYGDYGQIPNEAYVGHVVNTSKKQHTKKPMKSQGKAAAERLGIEWHPNDNEQLLQECAAWLGVPYQYGGNTKSGVDCSGLTCYVYNKVYKKKLHRRSIDQYNYDVHHKSKKKLKQGNLVFFSTSKSGGKCGHVGIYLKDNKFIHASTSRGVVVDNLDGNYWVNHWLNGGEVR